MNQTMKDLQKIKEQVGEGFGYKSNPVFSAYEQLLINPHGLTYKVLNDSVDQIAIRYANEQNRELVFMLEKSLGALNDCIMVINQEDEVFYYTKGLISDIEKLLYKHRRKTNKK